MINDSKSMTCATLVCVTLILGYLTYSVSSSNDNVLVEHMAKRKILTDAGKSLRTGAAISLSAEEEAVHAFLVKIKSSIIEGARVNSTPFSPPEHFFYVKNMIEESKLFKILQKLPKPGNLNLHLAGGVDTQWLVKNATYRENCYICYDMKGIQFHFFPSIQVAADNNTCLSGWKLIKELRSHSGSAQPEFDEGLFTSMTLSTPDPQQTYPNRDVVMDKLESASRSVESLLAYRPVYIDGLKNMLMGFYDDNVQYLEMRHPLNNLYDISGSQYNSEEVIHITQETVNEFKSEHSDFFGANIIYTAKLNDIQSDIKDELDKYTRWRTMYPNIIVGFDIDSEQDFINGSSDILRNLLNAKYNGISDVKYFFSTPQNSLHYTTNNIVDVILMNSSRIGNGLALTNHPVFTKKVKEHGLAIEINPLSNQVLMLVGDLRDHPAAEMLSRDIPVVIGSDKSALVGTSGLSYDYYATLLGLCGEKDALKLLKQLSINSIEYSALGQEEKTQLSNLWYKKWNTFIKNVITEESLKVEQATHRPTGGAIECMSNIFVTCLFLCLVVLDTQYLI